MGEADKQDLERLLRRGAYGVLNDDDTAAKEFCDANIDEILARQSRVVVHKGSFCCNLDRHCVNIGIQLGRIRTAVAHCVHCNTRR